MIGQTVSHYRILEKLGEGGMGEVYLAEDTGLKRRVALKFLPDRLQQDTVAQKRFLREAESAAALNHPFICNIHEVAQTDRGQHFICMEYVEGETLGDRLSKGRLPIKDALQLGVEISEALEVAHHAGVVHRDLKPANIMLTRQGHAKVMDFGLAKKVVGEGGIEQDISSVLTREGATLGTLAYMSPEQVRGDPVDHRSDLFSFGIVLHEMLTGVHPFRKPKQAETAAMILQAEPPALSRFLSDAPELLERLVRKLLAKSPIQRPQTFCDVRTDLQELRETSAPMLARSRVSRSWRFGRWIALVLVAVAVGMAGWFFYLAAPDYSSPKTRPLTTYPGVETDPALSPDGRQVAFIWRGESGDVPNLYVKLVEGGEPLLVSTGPGPASSPAWSPDAGRLAFFRKMKGEDDGPLFGLFVVSALGGDEQRLATCRKDAGLSWSPDGRLLAFPDEVERHASSSIHLLSLDTGERWPLTSRSPHLSNEWSPRFSPDGSTLAFMRGGPGTADIFLTSLESGEEFRLTVNNPNSNRLDWTADGRSIVFSALRPGRVGLWSLWRVSTSGGEPEPLGVGEQGLSPTVSRQGANLVYEWRPYRLDTWRIQGPSSGDEPKIPVRLISSTALDYMAHYSPDGQEIIYTSSRSGTQEIWVCDSEGKNARQLTFLDHPHTGAGSWSPDGTQIAFMSSKEGSFDIYTIGSAGGFPTRLTEETSADVNPSWSRDGHWIYFISDRTGRTEVWKIPAEGGRARQVTRNGGTDMFESPDGKFLFFNKQGVIGGLPGIWRMPVEGGEEVQMLEKVRFSEWTVSKNDIYYINRTAGPGEAIERFDLLTGEVKRIGLLQHSPNSWGISVSPDSRWIIYSVVESDESDLILVENFR
jgi:Tol biopolymer transport system component/serine/threonine protein kinase